MCQRMPSTKSRVSLLVQIVLWSKWYFSLRVIQMLVKCIYVLLLVLILTLNLDLFTGSQVSAFGRQCVLSMGASYDVRFTMQVKTESFIKKNHMRLAVW